MVSTQHVFLLLYKLNHDLVSLLPLFIVLKMLWRVWWLNNGLVENHSHYRLHFLIEECILQWRRQCRPISHHHHHHYHHYHHPITITLDRLHRLYQAKSMDINQCILRRRLDFIHQSEWMSWICHIHSIIIWIVIAITIAITITIMGGYQPQPHLAQP